MVPVVKACDRVLRVLVMLFTVRPSLLTSSAPCACTGASIEAPAASSARSVALIPTCRARPVREVCVVGSTLGRCDHCLHAVAMRWRREGCASHRCRGTPFSTFFAVEATDCSGRASPDTRPSRGVWSDESRQRAAARSTHARTGHARAASAHARASASRAFAPRHPRRSRTALSNACVAPGTAFCARAHPVPALGRRRVRADAKTAPGRQRREAGPRAVLRGTGSTSPRAAARLPTAPVFSPSALAREWLATDPVSMNFSLAVFNSPPRGGGSVFRPVRARAQLGCEQPAFASVSRRPRSRAATHWARWTLRDGSRDGFKVLVRAGCGLAAKPTSL